MGGLSFLGAEVVRRRWKSTAERRRRARSGTVVDHGTGRWRAGRRIVTGRSLAREVRRERNGAEANRLKISADHPRGRDADPAIARIGGDRAAQHGDVGQCLRGHIVVAGRRQMGCGIGRRQRKSRRRRGTRGRYSACNCRKGFGPGTWTSSSPAWERCATCGWSRATRQSGSRGSRTLSSRIPSPFRWWVEGRNGGFCFN